MSPHTPTRDADAVQRAAADPAASAWVAASAGTGKTKVLTDRVLRLMLPDRADRAGSDPARLLCITFTRAAAAEMSTRLTARLTQWATMGEAALEDALADLLGDRPTPAQRAAARQLLARVLDAPGQLQIATIHAFCQSVLRRFPLEAGLPPGFTPIDERAAADLLAAARAAVAADPDPAVSAARDAAVAALGIEELGRQIGRLAADRLPLARAIATHGGLAPLLALAWRKVGLAPGETAETITAAAVADGTFDRAGLTRACQALATGGPNDRKKADAIAPFLAAPDAAGRLALFDLYIGAFLTKDKKPFVAPANKPLLTARLEIGEILAAEAVRLADVVAHRAAAERMGRLQAVLTLGWRVIEHYEHAKAAEGRVDYDDLVDATARLLQTPGVAPWVLYKLDGGIDHLLIDEAQDTNPDQWAVAATLAAEFFAGLDETDERARPRTLFVVGDEKQSIFSFQRADPAAFHRMQALFAERIPPERGGLRRIGLNTSFRSGPAVLDLVNAVFADPAAGRGVAVPWPDHRTTRYDHRGRVALWPLFTPAPTDPEAPWSVPDAQMLVPDPAARLADRLAREIRGWRAGGEILASTGRPIDYGDILILVRRRNRFFHTLVRRLKEADIPITGVDRMHLAQELAVRDLLALADVLLLAEDDLALATVLKSPLIGLDEAALFDLAYHRDGVRLWPRLAASADPAAAAAHAWLDGLRGLADRLRPFELFAHVLAAPCPVSAISGRHAMLARLGAEAEDPLDELLAEAVRADALGAIPLQGFVHQLRRNDPEIKREHDAAAGGRVRIMTVHGAKGLQAGIVILPDTVVAAPPRRMPVRWDDDAVPVWIGGAGFDAATAAVRAQAIEAEQAEERRLLYVALTRAEDRLLICGWHGDKPPRPESWYLHCRDALESLAAAERADFDDIPDGLLHLVRGGTVREGDSAADTAPASILPDWAHRPAPPEPPHPRRLAPSAGLTDDGSEPAVLSPLPDAGGRARFRRGLLVHRLLETLPELPAAARAAAAGRYLDREAAGDALAPAEAAALAAETLSVLDHPDFAPVFGPGSRAEVAITGRIGGVAVHGRVDRLVVRPEQVLVVDFKTNRPPPADLDGVAPLYWRQMAAYRAVLQRLYPDRPVRCALLWTDTRTLMELPAERLDRTVSGTICRPRAS